MKPRIWIVSELYHPDVQATSRILATLAEGLTSDFDVHVVSGTPMIQFDPAEKAERNEVFRGVTIRRIASVHLDRSILFFRLINLVTISIPMFVHLVLRLRRSDRVLVVTNPPVLPFIAAMAAAMRGAPCFVLVHDVYPDVLLPAGLLRQDGLLYRLLQVMTRRMFCGVQGIVALGRDMAELVQTYLGDRRVPVRIIPNWSEPKRIFPIPKSDNRFLRERSLADKFVVLHAGTMGWTHGIEDLLDSARRFRGRSDVHFVFAGIGVKRQLVERAIQEPGASHLSLLPFVDASEQNELLNACDIAMIAMRPGMCGVSVPSRMYNSMAAGKPIIAVTDARSELARVILEEEIGWVVEPGHPDALCRAIEEARVQPELIRSMGARARHVAETKYTEEASVRAFAAFLQEVDTR